MNELVSVVVPIYNVKDFLEECIISITTQSYRNIEIILVDDGSTDGSSELCNMLLKNDNRIRVIHKKNGGLSDARNFAIPYAKGEYIAFLDSDDYVENNMYKDMYELAKKENSDMVECDFYWEYPNKTKVDIGEYYYNKKEMLEKVRVVAWNKLIKREILEKTKIKFPNGYRYEDVEFTYKLIPYLEKISFLKKPCIHYVQREESISNLQNERTKEIFDVLDHVINYYKEKNIYDEYKEQLEYIYTRYLLCSSLLRMVKVNDKEIREKLIEMTWTNLNTKFPNWKKNNLLKKKNKKNILKWCNVIRMDFLITLHHFY